MRSLLSVKDLDRNEISEIIAESNRMRGLFESGKRLKLLDGGILATLFYKPSTRTRLSFESAMQRPGGGVIGFVDKSSSSAMKGESLADTVRVVSTYSDIIVLRHNETGAAREAALYLQAGSS